jgi:hypothetical protein
MPVALIPISFDSIRWILYDRSDEIDPGEPGHDDAALSGGVYANRSRFSRHRFGGLFVDKNHLARIE